MLKVDCTQWVGRTETQTSEISLQVLEMVMAATHHAAVPTLSEGDAVPILGHWSAFTPKGPMAEISTDGHPHLGGFLPPVPLRRRMWAGGQLTFHAPLHIGHKTRRHSKILSVAEKEGAAGPMVFVSVEHTLSQGDQHAITERQDIVYLDIPKSFTPPKAKPVPEDPDLLQAVELSEAMLFRYSAATFNAHRIHYDLAYAETVEKYPGLVVHGPLQATLLLHAAMRHTGRQPKTFEFRGIHPMFHFDDMHLFGHNTPTDMTLCTGIPGAHQGMTAKVTWQETTS